MVTSSLVDQYGRPIDFGVLTEEIAGPKIMSVRSILTGHPSEGLTPGRLAAILRGAEANDPIRYLELAEQMEEKHPQYASTLGTRKEAVAQLEITVEASGSSADEVKQADFIRDWLKRDELQDELIDMLDAIGKGRSHTEIIWDTSEGQWIPSCLKWRDPRWFHTDYIDGETPQMYSDDGLLVPLPPWKFIVHDHKAKSGLAIRGGLARPVSWIYMFQNYTLKDWVAFAEVYGLPLRVGRYDNGASKEDINLLLRAVSQIGSDAAAVIPKSMEVEFIDGGAGRGGSVDLFNALCNYLDGQVSKLVLGQTATTDSVVGGLGSGKEHGEVRDDIKLADGRRLGASINRQLVRPMVDANFGPQKTYPRVRLGMAEQVDMDKLAAALGTLVPLGLKVKQSEVRGKLGLEDPEEGDDEDLLKPAAASDPGEGAAVGQAEKEARLPGPPGGQEAANAASMRAGADSASRALLSLLTAASAPGAARRSDPDAIDQAVAADLDDWRQLVSPAADAIDQLLAGCANLEEARARLPEAIARMNPVAAAELMVRGGFSARLAGLSGQPVAGHQVEGE